jgi:hypothetical protein
VGQQRLVAVDLDDKPGYYMTPGRLIKDRFVSFDMHGDGFDEDPRQRAIKQLLQHYWADRGQSEDFLTIALRMAFEDTAGSPVRTALGLLQQTGWLSTPEGALRLKTRCMI